MSKSHKNIWECHLTIHGSISEKDNFIFFSIAQDINKSKMKIITELAKEHPLYKKKLKHFEDIGKFKK
jgi:hypothetical protein